MARRYRHVAEYYDFEYAGAKMLQEDVPFFMGQLPRKQQSILELCVGTGRAAIPLAQAGHRVVGVDYASDMLQIARRKRDAVGMGHAELELVRADVLRLDLKRRFDWVCIFFNTFLAFSTLAEQDRLLRVARQHMKASGRLWLDIFNPDLSLIADPKLENLEPAAFFVPRYERTVFKTTSIRRTGPQTEHVTFHYRWFDHFGREQREAVEFHLTFLFPRELQILLERNRLRIEKMWGNYDGSAVTLKSPRIIVRCCRT